MEYLVIKAGGSVIDDVSPTFYQELAEIQSEGRYQPIIVHGGGKLITRLLGQLDIPTTFVNGLRVTTVEMLDVIEMALSGSVNKMICRSIQSSGGRAVGISGIDGGLIQGEQISEELGYTGSPKKITEDLLIDLCGKGYIPVVSPVGQNASGQRLNINADTAAAAIASALKCPLLLMSDIPGIYSDEAGERKILSAVSTTQADMLIGDGTITGGMIPKVNGAREALINGVKEVLIFSGKAEKAISAYCKGQKIGTKIYLSEELLHA
ncbi:acetylglutamate kinase [Neobacillus terrae]|uniref:acetylglutamate kinase n=1 Tax=Neobacillus terrae TaxID=3034837 RepID=UPI00140DF3A8|nr:acetylglutamate kinase [Neobacillus terrae]NHM32661.1 acetylglutamate kinase [Neobacillus terrae]